MINSIPRHASHTKLVLNEGLAEITFKRTFYLLVVDRSPIHVHRRKYYIIANAQVPSKKLVTISVGLFDQINIPVEGAQGNGLQNNSAKESNDDSSETDHNEIAAVRYKPKIDKDTKMLGCKTVRETDSKKLKNRCQTEVHLADK